jgi:hypothetical protein
MATIVPVADVPSIRRLFLEIMTVWSKRAHEIFKFNHELAFAMSDKLRSLFYTAGLFEYNIRNNPLNHERVITDVLLIVVDIVTDLREIHARSLGLTQPLTFSC